MEMNPAALVDAYLDRVYRFLLALVGDTEMARDLTQETFLRLQRGGPHPDPAGPGLAYVFATARNTAISHLRRRSLEERHLSPLPPEEIDALARPEPAQGPAAELERSEIRAALHDALAAVPEPLRATFLLSEVEGLSYAQIGSVMECPPGTVASRKHQAVQQLRRLLRRRGVEL
jgi:RNA polymerase sigma-70 factor (ECF subfamily)